MVVMNMSLFPEFPDFQPITQLAVIVFDAAARFGAPSKTENSLNDTLSLLAAAASQNAKIVKVDAPPQVNALAGRALAEVYVWMRFLKSNPVYVSLLADDMRVQNQRFMRAAVAAFPYVM